MEKVGRTYRIPCSVNGLSLDFILDTGADQVSISLSEALKMIKTGVIDKNDLLNTEYYQLANGELVEGTTLIIRELKIGGLTIKNVEASIVHSLNAPLLLGQSALSKLGKITIDYKKNELIINENQEISATKKGSLLDYYITGNENLQNGDYLIAIANYSKVIEIDPNYSDAYNKRGMAQGILGKHNNAIEDFDQAIKLNPYKADFYNNRGSSLGKLEKYNEALEDLDKAILLDSTDEFSYFNRGVVKVNLDIHETAIDDLSRAIYLNPNKALTYYYRGTAKLLLTKYNDAVSDFNNAIKLDSNDEFSYHNRGQANYNLKKYKLAIEDYTKAIEINPKYMSPYLTRGFTHFVEKNYKEAITDFNISLNDDSNDIEILYYRGLAKEQIGDFRGAYDDLLKAKLINPDYPKLYGKLKEVVEELNKIELNDITKEILKYPKNAELYNARGLVYLNMEDVTNADKDFTMALKLKPIYAEAFIYKNIISIEKDQTQKIIDLANMAIEMDSTYANSYYFRGLAKRELGNDIEALKDFTKAIDLDNFFINAYYKRGNLFSKLGMKAERCLDYKKIITLSKTIDPLKLMNVGINFENIQDIIDSNCN